MDLAEGLKENEKDVHFDSRNMGTTGGTQGKKGELRRESSKPQEFEPGSIHKNEFRNYWKNELNASDWVMKTLEEGYEIPFKQWPGRYEEKNNASALKDMRIVRNLVADMIRIGV
jgi:hypothetical protein